MHDAKWVALAAGLLGFGLAVSAAGAGDRVTDLSPAARSRQEKAVGPSSRNQHCPVRGKRVEVGGAGAILDTGVVSLGVVDGGNLIWGGTGLYFDSTFNDVLTPGCPCESWGVADAITGRFGDAGSSWGYDNIIVDSFTSTSTSAVSVSRIVDPNTEADVFKVTHDYHPSLTNNLFECTVTIQNISGAAVDLRYRRAIDWDMTPTAFSEMVTLKRNGATKITYTSDNGFANPNPLSGPAWIFFQGEAVDSGPGDHGCLFDLGFGSVAPNQSVTFYFYIGGGPDQITAMAALASVGAEAYSLAKPNPGGGCVDCPGTLDSGPFAGGLPNTAVFGLKGVGGKRIVAPQSFLDDYLRSALCVAWDPGYYQWSILSGNGAGNTYVGLGQVLNGNQKIVSFPGDPESMNFTFDKLHKKASGYFTSPEGFYSPLFDKLTTDDPPCGYKGQPTGTH